MPGFFGQKCDFVVGEAGVGEVGLSLGGQGGLGGKAEAEDLLPLQVGLDALLIRKR